jgi:hypothetical protein
LAAGIFGNLSGTGGTCGGGGVFGAAGVGFKKLEKKAMSKK